LKKIRDTPITQTGEISLLYLYLPCHCESFHDQGYMEGLPVRNVRKDDVAISSTPFIPHSWGNFN
jgi:hypothetical protein